MKNKNDRKKEHKSENLEEINDELGHVDQQNHENQGQDADALEQRIAELEDQYKRAVADYRNLEKRVAEERLEFIKFANKELLERLLPAFDTLFLAERYVKDDGLKLTIKSLADALEQVGVTRVETVGKEFDPSTMECVETVDGDEGKVTEEVRPGFKLADRTLRAALVKVGVENKN